MFLLGCSVLSLWVKKKIFGQYLCLKHTKHQFQIVLFVQNWLLKSVSYLIFCNSDSLIREICMTSKCH